MNLVQLHVHRKHTYCLSDYSRTEHERKEFAMILDFSLILGRSTDYREK